MIHPKRLIFWGLQGHDIYLRLREMQEASHLILEVISFSVFLVIFAALIFFIAIVLIVINQPTLSYKSHMSNAVKG